MSRFGSLGLALQRRLQAVSLRWRQLDGLLLVDANGLPLASTVRTAEMEERLAAVAGLGASLVERAQDDLDLESVHVLHLGGQRRQLFLVPIQGGFTLVALADADANPADISRLLLATARDLLTLPETVEDDEDRRRVRRHRAELGRPDHQQ